MQPNFARIRFSIRKSNVVPQLQTTSAITNSKKQDSAKFVKSSVIHYFFLASTYCLIDTKFSALDFSPVNTDLIAFVTRFNYLHLKSSPRRVSQPLGRSPYMVDVEWCEWEALRAASNLILRSFIVYTPETFSKSMPELWAFPFNLFVAEDFRNPYQNVFSPIFPLFPIFSLFCLILL